MIADAVSRTRVRTYSDKKLMSLMLAFSLVLHGGVVLLALSKWGFSRGKFPLGPVYSVELVSLPQAKTAKYPALGRKSRKTRAVSRSQAIPIKRFSPSEQALTLKKKQRTSAVASEPEEVKLAEEVMSKIERRPSPAQAEVPTIDQESKGQPAPSRKTVSLVKVGEMKGGELSQALMLYRALVNEKIESNWALPERLNQGKDKLEAVVVVRVRRDGTVFDIQFEKKSGDSYFDDSVLKAVLKSKPFPPFPDIYSPSEEEIVIRFAPEKVSF
jgi:colicin import membrane protein